MLRSLMLASLLVAMATAPALAADKPRAAAAPDPAAAASLSVGVPLLLTVGAVTITSLQYPVFGIAMPLGFGAGQLYAGDPARAALVGLGGYAAAGTGGLIGYGIDNALNSGHAMAGTTGMVTGAALALAVYGGWAAYDAYRTAEAKAAIAKPE
jgi:hypothetical protein